MSITALLNICVSDTFPLSLLVNYLLWDHLNAPILFVVHTSGCFFQHRRLWCYELLWHINVDWCTGYSSWDIPFQVCCIHCLTASPLWAGWDWKLLSGVMLTKNQTLDPLIFVMLFIHRFSALCFPRTLITVLFLLYAGDQSDLTASQMSAAYPSARIYYHWTSVVWWPFEWCHISSFPMILCSDHWMYGEAIAMETCSICKGIIILIITQLNVIGWYEQIYRFVCLLTSLCVSKGI